MADVTIELLKTHFRQLRLPTMGQEFEKLARDALAANQTVVQFLLRLTELEWATRAANAVATRIKQAEFPVLKDFDTYDFSVIPGLSKPKVLELLAANGLSRSTIVVWWGIKAREKRTFPLPWVRLLVARACECGSSPRRPWSASWRRRRNSTRWIGF